MEASNPLFFFSHKKSNSFSLSTHFQSLELVVKGCMQWWDRAIAIAFSFRALSCSRVTQPSSITSLALKVHPPLFFNCLHQKHVPPKSTVCSFGSKARGCCSQIKSPRGPVQKDHKQSDYFHLTRKSIDLEVGGKARPLLFQPSPARRGRFWHQLCTTVCPIQHLDPGPEAFYANGAFHGSQQEG